MTRKLVRLAVFAAAVVAVVGTTVGLNAQDKKTYTIKQIMKEHGKKGAVAALKTEVAEGKWDDAKKDAAKLKEVGEALGTLKAEKGDADSWKKLAAKYKENTAAVAEAVDKKDEKAATAALGKIGGSCKECHSVHK